MELRSGDLHTFWFFRDKKGRLRATWKELGMTKPVESADGKRYKFEKVFDVENCFSNEEIWALQLGGENQNVVVKAL